MEWLSASWGYYCSGVGTVKDMIEQANEELQILEAEHPNRFNYLKVELKSFISHLESQSLHLSTSTRNVVPDSINNLVVPNVSSSPDYVASSVSTQESSAGKKRKKVRPSSGTAFESNNVESRKAQKISCMKNGDDGCNRKKETIDAVFERARACLHKIQQLKTSFS